MNNNTFWNVVELVNWPLFVDDRKYSDMVKRHMLWAWSPRQVQAFRKELTAKHGALHAAIRNWEEANSRINLGEDSYGDLLHHIIGCGREAYQDTMEDPSLAKKRADTYDFHESFAYCIPHLSSYEMLSPSYYSRQKHELERELEQLYEERRKDLSKEALSTISEMCKLLHTTAWSAEECARIKELSPRVRDLVRWHWGAENLAGDYERYKLPVPQEYAHLSALC